MIFGKTAMHRVIDRTDRVGIRSLTFAKLWQASSRALATGSVDAVDAERPAGPPTPAGMEFVGLDTAPHKGGYLSRWSFTGVHGDPKNVPFKTRGSSPDYQFAPGFSEKDIALLKNLQALLDTYEGFYQDGQIQFPLTYTDASGQEHSNPMFGQKSFFRIEGTYTYRYCALSLSDVPVIEGRIFETGSLPGQAKNVAGRNYLGAGTAYQRQGPVLEIMETYWMSGEGGWPRPIYGGGSGSASSNRDDGSSSQWVNLLGTPADTSAGAGGRNGAAEAAGMSLTAAAFAAASAPSGFAQALGITDPTHLLLDPTGILGT